MSSTLSCEIEENLKKSDTFAMTRKRSELFNRSFFDFILGNASNSNELSYIRTNLITFLFNINTPKKVTYLHEKSNLD